ncbi:hypothetical protein JCM30566_03690 [Marinitoga arctica]
MKKIIFLVFLLLSMYVFSKNIEFKSFNTYYTEHKIYWNSEISHEGSVLYYLDFTNEELPHEMTFITEYQSVLISGEKKGYIYHLKVTAKNIDREYLGESDEATLIIYDDDEEPLRIIGSKVENTDDKKIIHFILRNVSSKTIVNFEIRYWGLDILGNPIRINRRSLLKHIENNVEIRPFDFYDLYIEVFNVKNLKFSKGIIWYINFSDESFWEKIVY